MKHMNAVGIMLDSVRDKEYYPFDDSREPRKMTREEAEESYRRMSLAMSRTRLMLAESESAPGIICNV